MSAELDRSAPVKRRRLIVLLPLAVFLALAALFLYRLGAGDPRALAALVAVSLTACKKEEQKTVTTPPPAPSAPTAAPAPTPSPAPGEAPKADATTPGTGAAASSSAGGAASSSTNCAIRPISCPMRIIDAPNSAPRISRVSIT